MNLRKLIQEEIENFLLEGIEDDAPHLALYIIADEVFEDLASKQKNYDELYDKKKFVTNKLVKIAQSLYKKNEVFKRKVNGRGNSGRAYLYMFMKHWYNAKLKTGRWIDGY